MHKLQTILEEIEGTNTSMKVIFFLPLHGDYDFLTE